MKHTISILVENHPGALSRIAGLFSRRGFNIDSLAVGVTHDPAFSRVTIVVNGDDAMVEQVEKQLNKLVDVQTLHRLDPLSLISRELMLVKLSYTVQTRTEMIDIAQVMQARILDISPTTLTMELSDTSAQLDNLLNLLQDYPILEVVRTGTIALHKGGSHL